jgi:hypothetical protein
MAVVSPAVADGARRRLRFAALIILITCLFGIFAVDFLMGEGFAQPDPRSGNIFFRLYGMHEAPFFWLLVAFAVGTWMLARRDVPPAPAFRIKGIPGAYAVLALSVALVVFAVTAAGTYWIMHRLPFSMDEFATDFQARIVAGGSLTAAVPVEWQPFGKALVPHFVTYRAAEQLWLSSYLPAYSALRALFSFARAELFLNPFLAAVSILAMAGASARLWPGDLRRGRLAILFLATSSQFVLMSMTAYAWAAHLCFNLLWLYLVLREDRPGLAAAPWVGALALGLHNPFPHALFAAPFLLRLLRTRRIGWIGYYAAVYGGASFMWYRLMSFSHSQVARGAAVQEFGLPTAQQYFVQGMNFSLLLTWQAPAMALFLVAAFFLIRSLKQAERDLMMGIVLTFAFYFLFPQNQGHGWGYRYFYSVLGSASLLAASATVALGGQTGTIVRRVVIASSIAALFVQLPLRLAQAERFVRPYAATVDYIRSRPADVVILDSRSAYYGRDLVRNDPFLTARPVTMNLPALQPADVDELVRRYPGRVYLLTVPEMQRLGLTTFGPGPAWVRR